MMKVVLIPIFTILIILGLNQETIAQQRPDNGLVLYYPFNGNANDESGNAFHGAVFGPQLTNDNYGNPDCAYLFDGQDDYIKALTNNEDDLDFTDELTVSAWVKLDSVNNILQAAISKEHLAGYGISYHGDTNKKMYFACYINGAYRIAFADEMPSKSRWYHLVGIYEHIPGNTGVVKLYVNSVLNGTDSTGGDNSITNSPVSLSIGSNPDPNDVERAFWTGAIDEVRIYNRVLSEEEIGYLYSSVYDRIIERSVRLFPNPTKEYLIVKFDNSFTDSDIEIYNAVGVLMASKSRQSDEERIDISGLTSGVYWVKIKSKYYTKGEKLIIH